MQSAKAYLRNGNWLFHSDCKSTAGVWIASSPFLCSDDCPLTLGSCVTQTLNSSTEGVPHPTQWNNLFRPILELAGEKSWNTFVKGAVLIGIESEGNKITLTPHRTLGPKEGFDPIQEKAVTLSVASSVEELGTALKDVVNSCVGG